MNWLRPTITASVLAYLLLGSFIIVMLAFAAPTLAADPTPRVTPLESHSVQFQSLAGIPGVNPNTVDIGVFINALYALAITIAGMFAVVRIILAGVQYMFSDLVTTKEQAKVSIRGAILGLLIVLGAALILGTINPNLGNLQIFELGRQNRITLDGIRPPSVNLQIGQEVDRTRVDPDAAREACEGEFVIAGGVHRCIPPTTATEGEYEALLREQGVPESERAELVRIFNEIPNTAEVRDNELALIQAPENDSTLRNDHADIRTKLNELISESERDAVTNRIAALIAEGLSREEAQQRVFVEMLREKALFIQVPGANAEDRQRVCERAGKQIFRTDVHSTPHLICL